MSELGQTYSPLTPRPFLLAIRLQRIPDIVRNPQIHCLWTEEEIHTCYRRLIAYRFTEKSLINSLELFHYAFNQLRTKITSTKKCWISLSYSLYHKITAFSTDLPVLCLYLPLDVFVLFLQSGKLLVGGNTLKIEVFFFFLSLVWS